MNTHTQDKVAAVKDLGLIVELLKSPMVRAIMRRPNKAEKTIARSQEVSASMNAALKRKRAAQARADHAAGSKDTWGPDHSFRMKHKD